MQRIMQSTSSRAIPAALALVAFALMIAAAAVLRPGNDQKYLAEGVLLLIIGAVVLALAVYLDHHPPPLSQPTAAPLDSPRHLWWLAAFAGALCLAALAAVNLTPYSRLHNPGISLHVQFALLLAGCLLVAYGLSGLPALRLTRAALSANRTTILLLGAIFALALVLRLWEQDTLQRYLIDELHWSAGVMLLEDNPNQTILTPMSGQSPYTWVFPYWQSGAVALLGHNFVGLRFVSAITGALTVLALYGLADALFDRKTALLAALLLATFPPHVHFSRVAMSLIADPLFGTLALMFLVRALRHNRRVDWAFGGVSLGMTQYFYEGGRLLYPPLLIGFVLLLALRGSMIGRWRGFTLLLIAALLVGAPVYTTLIADHRPLFGRYDDSGLGTSHWSELAEGGITLEEAVDEVLHAFSGFMIFAASSDKSIYYGGEGALILDPLLPFFFFGAFYLLWRYPAPAFLIPLWIAATVAGNALLRNTLVSARYYVVVPALALALTAGFRCLFALLVAPDHRSVPRWRRAVVPLAICLVALMQVGYYFTVHLPYYTVQTRDSKGYRDGIDVALRAVDLPGNTQIFIVGKPEHDQSVPRGWLAFLARDGDPARFFPLLSIPTDTLSPRFLLDLPGGVNYAFFVAADEINAMQLIRRYFPSASPAQFSTASIPAHKEYVLFFVPA